MAARTPSHKVSLGQFYTSAPVADLMVSLTGKETSARVLEPSCGPGAFLTALARAGFGDLTGVDLDPANVAAARSAAPGARIVEGDFLRFEDREGFDLVIGNPPYVRWGNLDASTRAELLTSPRWSGLANGQWDLLYAFMVHALSLLRAGGELIFIVPANWMASTYAASLRRHLRGQGGFEALIHFSEFKLFADCYPNCLILRYRKGADPARLWVAEYTGRRGEVEQVLAGLQAPLEELRRSGDQEIERREGPWHVFTAPQFVPDEPWFLIPAPERARAEANERMCRGAVLGDHADIGVGVVSGRDVAYELTPGELAEVPDAERRLVRGFVKAGNCTRYRVEGATTMLFPEGLSELELRASAPWTAARLEGDREQLEARYRSASRPWFAWATIRNMPLLERTRGLGKIFVPGRDRSSRPRFAYTEQDLMGAGDTVMIAPRAGAREDVRFLLAWLNSARVATWYRHNGARMGERARYTPPFLAAIPFPAIDWDDPLEAGVHERVSALAGRRAGTKEGSEAEAIEEGIEEELDRLEAHRKGTPAAAGREPAAACA